MWLKIVSLFVVVGHLAGAEIPEADTVDETKLMHMAASDRDGRAIRGYEESNQASENSFYPSFSAYDSQPLGHSRPFYYNQQEGAYSHRPTNQYQNSLESSDRYSGYKDNQTPQKPDHSSILGSGNFGVIPGGTFFSDNDGEQSSTYENYDSYSHNGHGRPSFYYNGASSGKPYPQEQFSNFKDFADINTPSDRQYSQYVVVYVPQKESRRLAEVHVSKTAPKNIMESLNLLDEELSTTTEVVPIKKLSKFKRKLALLPPEKKHFEKNTKKTKDSNDSEEPLIALS